MQVGIVPIRYGLPVSTDRDDSTLYWEARERLFPNVALSVRGGCTVHVETKTEILYCEVCGHARTEWLRAHPQFAELP